MKSAKQIYTIVEQTPNAEGLVPYRPLSNGKPFGIFTPASMGFETQVSLYNFSQIHGDMDEFVMEQLKIKNKEELYKLLSAEQIDGVGLTIHQLLEGRGMIIGDQTGIGKGRQAAAIIRFGIVNGYNTIFVTENSTLFTDMYRDLRAIGSDDFVPYIYNNDDSATIMYDENTPYHKAKDNKLFQPKKLSQINAELQEKLEGQDFTLPEGHDFLMLTYSQINTSDITKPKIGFLKDFSRNAIFVLDEAHNAGGTDSNTGRFMRQILIKSKGCCYLSATYAKRADNMPLYTVKTSLQDTGLNDPQIQMLFEKGDVPMQEIAASELSKSGQMLRRQRSNAGIEVRWNYLESKQSEHFEKLDELVGIMYDIGVFQRKYLAPYFQALTDAMQDTEAKQHGSRTDLGVRYHDFFSVAHNLVGQMMFALKAKDVAEEAIELLKQNKKVVIAFMRTNGAFLQELGYKDGEAIDRVDFGLLLNRAFQKSLEYELKTPEGETGKRVLTYDEISQDFEMKIFFDRLVKRMETLATDLTISPIDDLIRHIESVPKPDNIGGHKKRNFIVRECTGRNGRIVYQDGFPVYKTFKTSKGKFFAEFNNGEADVLLINQSAATGVSAHASIDFKDQRQRWMIIHEPELDINKEVQKRGRINRTGQVVSPGYLYISTQIPSEQRIFMVLQNKLKKLDANTTGNQKNSKNVLDVLDFYNKYGGEVIFKYLEFDNTDLRDLLHDPCFTTKIVEGEKQRDVRLPYPDIPNRVTNRIQLMSVDVQQQFYDTVIDRYKEMVERQKELGEYNLEIETLDFKSVVLKRYLSVQGTGAPNTYGQDAMVEIQRVNRLKNPYTLAKIDTIAADIIGDKSKAAYYQFIKNGFIEYFETSSRQQREKEAESLQEASTKRLTLQNQVDELAGNADMIEQYNKLLTSIRKLDAKIETLETNMENDAINQQSTMKEVLDMIDFFQPRQGLVMRMRKDESTMVELKMLVIGVVINLKDHKQPFNHKNIRVRFAINNATQEMSFVLGTPVCRDVYYQNSRRPKEEMDAIAENWNATEANRANYDYHPVIGAGNIFIAFNRFPNRLIKYTTAKGEVINGILAPKLETKLTPQTPDEVDTEFLKDAKLMVSSYKGKEYSSILLAELKSIPKTHPLLNMQQGGQVEVELFSNKGTRKFYIRKEYNTNKYTVVVTPKQFSDVINDEELLQYAIPTQEELRQGKSGSFKTYTGNYMYAQFEEQYYMSLLEILRHKYGFGIKSNEPIEVDIDKRLYVVDVPVAQKLPTSELEWQTESLKMELATIDVYKPSDFMKPTGTTYQYFAHTLQPKDFLQIAKLPIMAQQIIVEKYGENLIFKEVIKRIEQASDNFTNQEPIAIEADQLLQRLLTVKGFIEPPVKPVVSIELTPPIAETVENIDGSSLILQEKAYKIAERLFRIMSPDQRVVVDRLLKEEGKSYFNHILQPLLESINAIPKLYATDGISASDKTIYAHFFRDGSDWYIAEWDGKDGLFGYAVLNGDWQMSEWGYTSLQELHSINAELDFYWESKLFKQIKTDIQYEKEILAETEKEIPAGIFYVKAPATRQFPERYFRVSPDEVGGFVAGYALYEPKGKKRGAYLKKDEFLANIANAMYIITSKEQVIGASEPRKKKVSATRTTGDNKNSLRTAIDGLKVALEFAEEANAASLRQAIAGLEVALEFA